MMLCPVCKLILSYGGSVRYQMLNEHVSNPNRESPPRGVYYCNNVKCEASAPEDDNTRILHVEKIKKTDPNNMMIFWDEHGSLYGWHSNNKELKFIDDNDGPFGSFQRKLNIEIYKKNENFTLLNVWLFYINVVYKYKADENGKILKKRINLETWIKSDIWKCIKTFNFKDGFYRNNHPSNFTMFLYLLKKFNKNVKSYYTKGHTKYAISELLRDFENKDNRLYHIVFKTYINVFYKRLYNRIK